MVYRESVTNFCRSLVKGASRKWRKLSSAGKLQEFKKDLNWNVWNRWTFNPASKMVVRGNQEPLSQKDLWNLPKDFQSEVYFIFGILHLS
jgi:hypothetical protein